MCTSPKERYHPPTPPTPDKLRSIQHVYKCKERYHPPTPPTPDKLRSIQHVYKCKERYHPPTSPLPQKKVKSCGVVPGPASRNNQQPPMKHPCNFTWSNHPIRRSPQILFSVQNRHIFPWPWRIWRNATIDLGPYLGGSSLLQLPSGKLT